VRYWYDGGPDSVDELALQQPLWFTNAATAADDVALIAFTSGTTGKPKGTVHFHRDVIAMCDCFPRSVLQVHKDDIFCGTPPLAFTFGLGGMLCFPLRYGASTVLVEKHTPQTFSRRSRASRRASASPRRSCTADGRHGRRLRYFLPEKCVSAGEALPDATRSLFRQAPASRSSTASARPR